MYGNLGVCMYAGSTCPLVSRVRSQNLTLLLCACMLLYLRVRGGDLHNTCTCKRLVIPESRTAVSIPKPQRTRPLLETDGLKTSP